MPAFELSLSLCALTSKPNLGSFLNSGYIAEEAEFMIRGAQGDLPFQSIGKYYALTKSGTKIDRRAMRDANIPRSMTEPFLSRWKDRFPKLQDDSVQPVAPPIRAQLREACAAVGSIGMRKARMRHI
jgi:hypothetical protein